jgi:ketosteroid isomerase-like protein
MSGRITPLAKPAAVGTPPGVAHEDIAALLARAAAANAALLSGDSHRYAALVRHTDDFTLMSPFGGPPTHGFDTSSERLAALGRFFRNGVTGQEVVQTYACADMAVLVLIERQRVEVGGLPAQDWPLRVTLVFRREGGEWCLAHRHADPLVHGIGLEQAAVLARGDRGAEARCGSGSDVDQR